MDDLNQQAQELVKKLLQLDFTKDKRQWRLLTSQLWETIERLELNSQLKLMISLVCELNQEQPMEKLLRNQLLTRMILIIHESGKFSWTNNLLYKDYAEEAILQTYEYLRRSPHNYNPNHENGASVITWLNGYLKWRIHDLKQDAQEEALNRQNPNIRGEDGEFINILDIQIAHHSSEKALILLDNLRNWAENEPELKLIHIRNSPDITASKIISSRLPDQDIEWQDLGREFNVSSTTLSSFYERQCRPRLKEYVESFGYELPDTPVDPVQNIKLIFENVEKIYKNPTIKTQVKEWVNTDEELTKTFCQNRTDLTANQFLKQLLYLLETKARLQTRAFSDSLDITVTQTEKFYEYRIQPKLHNWLENQGYNLREIYN
jgi:hypothetical protein